MARYQCRKEAARARMQFRPKPTPKSEVKAMRVQANEQRDIADEIERLVEQKDEKDKPETKPTAGKPGPKPKPKKPKVVKAEVPKKAKDAPEYGKHGHDFNSVED